ncbi:MAG: RNA polymerase subunit sigma-24 [Caulobacterales bacterium 32-69-10]|nr:MAG: RNA polymerase subunit sigma-24 [Caulobacterales bacterium 32-69-10]
MDSGESSPLLETYLSKRADLVRLFTVRLRSATAAEDLVQELYLKVQTLSGLEVSNPVAFLYKLGSNLMLDKLRKERRSVARDHEWYASRRFLVGGNDAVDEPSPEDALAARRRLAQIVEAVKAMPPRARQAFELHKLQGMSHAETARAMGVSVSAIEKLISDAMKRLSEKLP